MKWLDKLFKRNLENPATPICSSTVDGYTTPGNASGQNVTPETSWNYTAVYAAVRLLSETVAQLPLVLYQKSGNTNQPATDHYLYPLIHNNPSDVLTSFVWRETQQAHTLTWGNGYAVIDRNSDDTVRSLMIANPASTQVYRDPGEVLPYYYVTINERHFKVPARNIIHIPGLGWDGYQGKSPITLHRETIGLSMAADEFGAQFFGNGTNWGGVIKHPATLKGQARENLKQGMDRFKGQGYSGLLLLDEGMDYTRIGIPPDDAQFLETRRFQVSEIARIFNVPNHMLNDLEKSSFNNISELSISFLRYTMSPWLAKWEQELNRKLLTRKEQEDGYYFRFTAGGLLRGTQQERYEAYGKGIVDGWLSRNEVRELEDLDPVEGLDEYLVPLNMGSSNDEPSEEQPQESDAEPIQRNFDPLIASSARSFAAWLADVDKRSHNEVDRSKRLVSKISAMTERYIHPVIEAAGVPDGIQRWCDWFEGLPADQLPTEQDIVDTLTQIVGAHTDG